MFSYTTIATDNDSIHIQSAILKDPKKGFYHTDPVITFYNLEGDVIRNPGHIIMAIWDDAHYLAGDLYDSLVKFCDLDEEDDFELPEGVEDVLIASGNYPEDLLALLERAITMGLLLPNEIGPFKAINSFS